MELEKWEAICKCCGACCFEKKIDRQGIVHTTSIPCRFLDIHERTCRIYPHRLEVEEDCIRLTPGNIADLSWLPVTCAYRKLQKEHPKITEHDDQERRQIRGSCKTH